jgi:hypothetical protein
MITMLGALRWSIVTLSLSLGLPAATGAQSREKVWAEIGVGAGSLGSSPSQQQARETIAVSHIALGGWLNPQWRLGVDFGGYEATAAGALNGRVIPVWVSGVVAFYPRTTSGFHVKGGVGASSVTFDIVDEFGETDTATLGTGLGLMAGAGWDVHLGRRFWLTPAVNVRYAQPGDLVLAGRTRVPDWKYNIVDFTVGIRFD